jgi:biotin carboxyl carrier protein
MKYVVLVEGKSIEVDVEGEQVTVLGRVYHATLSRVPGTPLRQLLLEDRPVTLLVEASGPGHWALSRAGERSEIEVQDERTRHIRTLAGNAEPTRRADVLRAPMPGLVVRVHTRAGDTVAVGAGLVVLEAMKMENELKAAAEARVRAVRVSPGEAVEKGQVLVEFEGP